MGIEREEYHPRLYEVHNRPSVGRSANDRRAMVISLDRAAYERGPSAANMRATMPVASLALGDFAYSSLKSSTAFCAST